MKTLLNKLVLGAVAAAITTVGAVGIMAQGDDAEKAALYTKFTGCYKAAEIPALQACIVVGKDYVQKYSATPDQYSDFVTKQIPKMEARIVEIQFAQVVARFNNAIKNSVWKDVFDTGKEILQKDPDNIDVILILASAGYDRAIAPTPDLTYKNDALNYAKLAIQKIESGKAKTENWGAATWVYAIRDAAKKVDQEKSKENALAWMNFTIARLIVDTNKDQTKALALAKEAAPYFYKSLQYNSEIKKDPTAYKGIGVYYREELNNSVDLYDKCCKDLTEDTEQAKNLRGMQLAYAERGADAYARAYKVAVDSKLAKPVADSLYKTLSVFYNVRFKNTTGVNEFVTKVTAQPLTDPSAAVTPVAEEPVVTPTTGAPGTATAAPGVKPTVPATTAPATTKPVNNTSKPATTTPPKPAGTTKGTISKKAPAKKKNGR